MTKAQRSEEMKKRQLVHKRNAKKKVVKVGKKKAAKSAKPVAKKADVYLKCIMKLK